MYLYVKDDIKTKNQLLKLKDKYEEQLEDMKNKENFLERVTTEKKQLNKRIDKIDKLFNNKELLTKQYAKRNKKFNDMNLETWTTMLKQEREKLLKKINECNLLIKPKEYIKNIESLEYKVKFLSEINEDKIIELCKTFLVGLNQIVKKTEDKKELVEIIYELRYYRFIPYKDKFLKDVEELKISFDEIMKQVIDKACKLRAIQTICEEAEENFTILKILFDTQIIDLQSISIEPKYEDDILYLQYYDDKIDIPITIFMYARKKDNSIIQKDYFIDENGQKYVEYIYNSPSISELSFSNFPNFHNEIKYYSITPEALFLCKSGNRPKDIYDCNVFKHIIDISKLKKLEESFKNNLPNTIIKAENDEYSNYIFENNTLKKVLVKNG